MNYFLDFFEHRLLNIFSFHSHVIMDDRNLNMSIDDLLHLHNLLCWLLNVSLNNFNFFLNDWNFSNKLNRLDNFLGLYNGDNLLDNLRDFNNSFDNFLNRYHFFNHYLNWIWAIDDVRLVDIIVDVLFHRDNFFDDFIHNDHFWNFFNNLNWFLDNSIDFLNDFFRLHDLYDLLITNLFQLNLWNLDYFFGTFYFNNPLYLSFSWYNSFDCPQFRNFSHRFDIMRLNYIDFNDSFNILWDFDNNLFFYGVRELNLNRNIPDILNNLKSFRFDWDCI